MPKQKNLEVILKPLADACLKYRFNGKAVGESASISRMSLAEQANVSYAIIEDIERNKHKNPTLKTIIKLANAIGLNVEITFVPAKK